MSDFFNNNNQRSINMNNTTRNINITPPNFQQQQHQPFQFRSPFLPNQIRRPDLIGKRTFNDFNLQPQQQQQQQSYGFYNRNVKPRTNYQQQQFYSSPISTLSSPIDLPILQQNRTQSWSLLNQNVAQVSNNFSLPNLTERNKQYWNNNNNNNNNSVLRSVSSGQVLPGQGQENKKLVQQCLSNLEKQLLSDDEEENVVADNVSALTESEWSETIQNLLNNPISPDDSSTSTSASPPTCPRQSLIDAATAISDAKPQAALEILTRLGNVANAKGSAEQRLVSYMVSALKARVNLNDRSPLEDMLGSDHSESRMDLFEVSPCFKLGFMAANSAILEAVKESGLKKIHVVDMDIGRGGQYVHLIHALAAAKTGISLKISALGKEEDLRTVRGGLKHMAQERGIGFAFVVKGFEYSELSREMLDVQSDEALVVNFAFLLCKEPDESVSVENKRDGLLRRVKGLSPVVMTVVEQQLNGNTAPLVTRVRDACEHYGALFESLDSTTSTEQRVRIEEGLGRKIANSVACEGRDRVERCEVFGKWRARMSMAGFQPRGMSQLAAESLRSRINSGTRGNGGFTVSEEFGGICFGWKGKTLTVASAWR